MMRGEMGFHSMSVSWPRFASLKPTPPVYLLSSPSCPEYRIFTPDVKVSCPESGHLVSQRPSSVMLFFCISVAICAALDVSSIVLTFQVAMLMVVLVSRSFGVMASRGFSPAGLPSRRRRADALDSLVFVSGARVLFYGVRYPDLTPNPPPLSGLGTGRALASTTPRRSLDLS